MCIPNRTRYFSNTQSKTQLNVFRAINGLINIAVNTNLTATPPLQPKYTLVVLAVEIAVSCNITQQSKLSQQRHLQHNWEDRISLQTHQYPRQ